MRKRVGGVDMKKIAGAAVVIFALLLGLAGCEKAEADPLAVFRGGFSADVVGELNGTAFSAVVKADAVTETGVLPLTVTFYAPSGLSGTVLSRDTEGRVCLSAGDLTLQSLKNADFSAFFSLFPTVGEVTEVELDQSGLTRVIFGGGSLLLLPDGTPHTVECAAGWLRVLSWES